MENIKTIIFINLFRLTMPIDKVFLILNIKLVDFIIVLLNFTHKMIFYKAFNLLILFVDLITVLSQLITF